MKKHFSYKILIQIPSWHWHDSSVTGEDTILEFSPKSESWTSVGMMREQRWRHAISVVNFEDFENHCNFSRSIDATRVPLNFKPRL